MSESNFLVILGRGCHYAGDGIVPDKLLTFFDDKAVWLLNDVNYHFQKGKIDKKVRRFYSRRNNVMDDMMLLVSLYVLAEEASKCEPLQEVINLASEKFNKDILKEDTLDPKDLQLEDLYEMNKKVFKEFAVLKFLAISLSPAKLKIGGAINAGYLPGMFRKKMKDYEVNSYEICETTNASYLTKQINF